MENIKKCLGILLSILVMFLILNQIKLYQGTPQVINITGTGKVTAVPDLATATVGVVTQGLTPEEVKASSTQKMNSVLAYLKQMGVADKDIQTTGFYTTPRYQYQSGKNSIIGYQSDQTVTVIFRSVNESKKQLETSLDNIIQYGANNVQGVRFNFSDDEQLKQEATKQAILKAEKEAMSLTSEAGLKLGKLINIIPSGGDIQISPMAYSMAAKAAGGAVNNIELGSQEVVTSVTLVYTLQ